MDKNIYATLEDLENLKAEILEEILATLPPAEEVSW